VTAFAFSSFQTFPRFQLNLSQPIRIRSYIFLLSPISASSVSTVVSTVTLFEGRPFGRLKQSLIEAASIRTNPTYTSPTPKHHQTPRPSKSHSSKMVSFAIAGLRGAQALFTILTLALSGALVAQQAIGGSPSQVNFALFTSIFAFLSCFYLLFAAFADGHPQIVLGLDGLNTLFTFAAGTALAAGLGVHSCGNIDYVKSNSITNGSTDQTARCHEAQALTAFLWFLFASFVASFALSFLGWRRGSAPGSRSRV